MPAPIYGHPRHVITDTSYLDSGYDAANLDYACARPAKTRPWCPESELQRRTREERERRWTADSIGNLRKSDYISRYGRDAYNAYVFSGRSPGRR